MEASQRLGYQPNLLAAGLRTGNTHTLGLVVMDITNSFYSELARGVEDCAFAEGFSVILCDSDLSPEKEALYLDRIAQPARRWGPDDPDQPRPRDSPRAGRCRRTRMS